ncbi:MAG: sugar ABC transporter ATP-binding protein [Rhodospirillaceae bacterium]|nr:sugar ABC transporter ATP-binding protein [Rhodospirillaceae bacterium]
MTTNDIPLLELSGISKTFGGVQALKDVDFTLRAGEIHGLVGENGAGKSTLMKIIAGVHTEYEGTMRLDGRPVRFRSARDALAAGIGMVHQELSVVPYLSVAENFFLGMQPTNRFGAVRWRTMAREAAERLRDLGIEVDPRTTLGALPLGLQQLVELGRVLFSGARIVILDEPTSALSPPEVKVLFEVLGRLRAGGRSFIFISHFLDDVLAISDEVTVFRNARKIATAPVRDIDKSWIIGRMIGAGHEELAESYTSDIVLESRPDAPVVLRARGLSRGNAFRGIDLEVRAGEVLGIYGFMGCGQLELARALAGKAPPDTGQITVDGRPVRLKNTARAKRAGIALVPESRRAMLFGAEPVYRNISISLLEQISRWLVKPERERRIAMDQVKALDIRPPSVERALRTLSGGNQQKVALGRWLARLPRVLVLSEPTRGMDVGAKDDVVKIVRGLRTQGMGVVVVSAEPETVLSLADRILVMKKGAIVHEFAGGTVSKDRLLAAA